MAEMNMPKNYFIKGTLAWEECVDDGRDEHVDENKDDQRIEIPRAPVQRKQLESCHRKLIHEDPSSTDT